MKDRNSFSKLGVLWAGLFYAVLAVVMTWPLAARMTHAIVGEIGDNIYFVWMIGWIKRALFDLQANPFDVWFLNYPEGWNMAYTEITPAQLLLALPFSLGNNPTFAYNMALLLTFVLSGLGMFLWVRRLTGRFDAGLIAGMVFGFLPYRFAHFRIGHLNLSGTQWLPFYFWGLCELLEARKNGLSGRALLKPVLLTGISFGLIAMTSQYYVYMALFISVFLVLYYLIFVEKQLFKDLHFWKQMVYAGLVSLPLVIFAIAPYATLAQQGGLPDRNLGIVRKYSASPTDFILPSTDHFLWGRWVGEHFHRDLWIEGTLYIGIVAGVLAVIALVKRKQIKAGRWMGAFLWTGIFALILAMGTDVHWNEMAVTIPTPAFLLERLGRDEIPLILPGFVLFHFFPFYAKLRALMRFGIYVLVFSSAAAGVGAAWLLSRFKGRQQTALLVLILALVFVDFYPGVYHEFDEISPRPVDYWLAEQPDGPLIQFPFIQSEDQENTYYTLYHRKPFVGGFFNAFPPPQYRQIFPIMEGFPDEASVALLKDYGVRYVLVDQDEYADMDSVRAISEDLGLTYYLEIDDQMIFLLDNASDNE